MAEAGGGTGCLLVQTDTVSGSCDVADPVDAVFYRRYQLVHADDHYDLVRSVDQCRYPIAVSVNVDQLAVQGDGISAHEIDISAEGIAVHLLGLFGSLCLAAIDEADITAVSQHVHHTAI